jgi:hypothetical protein
VSLIPVATTTVTANATQTVDITLGAIQGAVSSSLVTSTCSPGVYLYSGNVTAPEDINRSAPSTDTNQPITRQQPTASSTPPYSYQFTALPPGTYTLAFTCQAASDNPAQADPTVTFNPVKTGIVVTADLTATANLP